MKVKVSELQGAALDWAVAKCDGYFVRNNSPHNEVLYMQQYGYSPSTDWSQGGPIIEREFIDITYDALYGVWNSSIRTEAQGWVYGVGDTPLIAAMRCYVASKLGDEVDVPEEL
jgi:hypothetical protein